MKLTDLRTPFVRLTREEQIRLLESVRANRVSKVRTKTVHKKKEVKQRKTRTRKPKTLAEAIAWAQSQLGKDET